MSASTAPKVRTALEGGVFTVTLADPTNRNALSNQLVAELLAAIDRADSENAVRVVVVTNEGTVFCAGADLSERTDAAAVSDSFDPATLFARIRRSPKPFVGKIAGHAVAGGTGLAAAMDISVATEDAKFGFTEVRIGVAPAVISVVCLPKMRFAEASDAILRGNRFDGSEAARLGLINRAVPTDDLDAAIEEIVADLLEGSPQGLARSKELLNTVPGMDLDAAIEWTGALSAALFDSAEAQAGMTAYLEKRPPPWSPRA